MPHLPLFTRNGDVDPSAPVIRPTEFSTPAGLLTFIFNSISLYNAIELSIIIAYTARRRRGLYFWSLVASTSGLFLHGISFILGNPQAFTQNIGFTIIDLAGWTGMVVGQSLALYSRLHLLATPKQMQTNILAMVLVNSSLCLLGGWCIAIVVRLPYPANTPAMLTAFSIYEKTQVTLFFLQEAAISSVYIWRCRVYRCGHSYHKVAKIRRMIAQLLSVNALVIVVGIAILVIEYSGMYTLQTAYKGWAYSVKLKAEISILNRLVDLAREIKWIEQPQQMRRQIEQEWTDTLDRTIGPGHASHNDDEIRVPSSIAYRHSKTEHDTPCSVRPGS